MFADISITLNEQTAFNASASPALEVRFLESSLAYLKKVICLFLKTISDTKK